MGACGSDTGGEPEPDPQASAAVQTAQDAELGTFLTDSEGISLYIFTDDTVAAAGVDPISACNDGCLAQWPVFHAEQLSVSSDLSAADFSSFTRADGAQQTTFKGRPLYYFAGDREPGDITGQGAGDVWFLAGTSIPGEDPEPVEASVRLLDNAEIGQHLANAEGRTLYVFLDDTKGVDGNDPVSACEGACATSWPVFHAAELTLGAGLSAADFGSFTRADGTEQTTFKGWPLYTFSGDAYEGDVTGHLAGGTWYAAGTELPGEPEPEPTLVTQREDSEIGTYLADGEGLTLYVFTEDTKGVDANAPVSACNDGCLAAWPIFYGELLEVAEGLDASDFGSFQRADGQMQSTYKGWPLYYFASDLAAGDITGHGSGGNWFAAGTPLPGGPEPTLVTEREDAEIGAYLADGEGITLYVFTEDTKGSDGVDPVSACNGGCLAAWPIFYGELLEVAEGLDAADFGSYQRADGSMQSTYKGWPLYYFASDVAPGDLTGHGSGGNWFAAGTPLPGAGPDAHIEQREDPELGTYLATADGKALYILLEDTKAAEGAAPVSACVEGCLAQWPPYFAADLVVAEGLDPASFDSFERADGGTQLTWKGWPLYTYVGDEVAGDVNGHGVADKWWAAGVPLPEPTPDVASAEDAEIGAYLATSEGVALYVLINDTKGTESSDPVSACVEGCLAQWPAFYVDPTELVLGEGLNPAAFDVYERADGVMQTTWQGWPLYTFAGDSAPGDVNGHLVAGTWYAAGTELPAPETPDVVAAEDAELGEYLATADGVALYVLTTDTKGAEGTAPVSTCTDGCLAQWPAFYVDPAELLLGEGLNAAAFDVYERADGAMQTTWQGWPLYTYAGDSEPGDVNGHLLGDKWFAAGTKLPAPPPATDLTIGSDASFGDYLADGEGMALYISTDDVKALGSYPAVSYCTGGCLDNWPVFWSEELALPEGLDAADFGSLTRADGLVQTTYKGWPLYYFAGDAAAGEVNGHETGSFALIAP